MQSGNTRFTFSVIIPVYNAEPFLNAAVDSIIGQTAGFEKNIQLILVNDGSTDRSGDICKDYQAKYSDNIVYIEKENGGVSSARNEGLEHVRGRYVNFLDSDDMWSKSSFEKVESFYLEHPDIAIVTGRLVLTGRDEGKKHHLDYKYKKTRAVDIYKNYRMPEMSCSKSFIRADLLKDIRFNESISVSEDLLLMNMLLLKEGKYGIVSDAEYYYRKREDNSSAIDTSAEKPDWYTETPKKVYKELIKLSKEVKGEVIPYIQYLLITDLQWRLDRAPSDILSDDERTAYLDDLAEILSSVEDKYILGQKQMSAAAKAYALRFKYGDAYEKDQSLRRSEAKAISLRAEFLNADELLIVEGRADEKYAGDEFFVYAEDDQKNIFKAQYKDYPVYDRKGVDSRLTIKGQVHLFKLPLKDKTKYSFYVTDGTGWKQRLKITNGRFSRLSGYQDSFFATDSYLIKSVDSVLCIYKRRLKTYIASVLRYNKQLKNKAPREVLSVRNEIIMKKMRKHKPVWIISDRSHLAKDNGIALFEYLMASDYKDKYDIRFLIDRDSDDYERISRIGKTIDFGSREHLVMQGLASLIISSNADKWVVDPYGSDLGFYRDLLDFKFVFLQHGVTINNVERWLQKYNKNISLLITSTVPERDSFINGNYGYDDSIVKLTGMCRFDKLQDMPEKLILFAPTWRKNLAGGYIGDSRRPYKQGFTNSEYFRFYNALINDRRVLDVMERKGYKGLFCIHPAMEEMAGDFDGNSIISTVTGTDYSEVLRRGALMVTDYSSICFDFAYMYKPVVYTQFDKDGFYENHLYESGYFSYENDGFGPVCYDYKTAVNTIIKLIENDCRQPDEYAERVKKTFAYTDSSNCERVARELERLK